MEVRYMGLVLLGLLLVSVFLGVPNVRANATISDYDNNRRAACYGSIVGAVFSAAAAPFTMGTSALTFAGSVATFLATCPDWNQLGG